jgi:hypothetical protein
MHVIKHDQPKATYGAFFQDTQFTRYLDSRLKFDDSIVVGSGFSLSSQFILRRLSSSSLGSRA